MIWVFMALAIMPPAVSRPAEPPRPGDWPLWGGTPERNMTSPEAGLPAEWDLTTKKNVKWVADLGTRTFGNVVVSGGKVLIGTNNGRPRNPLIEGDKGVLMCFAEGDGRFLWQAVHDKLPEPDKHDWPEIGLCSVPCVVGNRAYYVSNRCELVCVDAEGFHDNENDGPVRDEKRTGTTDADFVWRIDLRKELGVVPFMACASAPVVADELVFIITGNGIDFDTKEVPAPDAPSFVAVNRSTGQIAWSDRSPGGRILSGQWSSPAYGQVNGSPQVVFPGGDGWLYAFEPTTSKLIWKFNCKAHEKDSPSAEEEVENTLVATPVLYDNKVFVAVGQDPEMGGGPGCLRAIGATGRGVVTGSAELWRYGGEDFGRSISTVAIRDGLLYAAELNGYLHCLDAATGKRLWRYDLSASCWSSPLVADGKVYIGSEDGDVFVLRHGRQADSLSQNPENRPAGSRSHMGSEKGPELLAKNTMNETVCGTAVAANGTLYVPTRSHLYAIGGTRAHAASQPADHRSQDPATRPAESRPHTGQGMGAKPDWPMFRGNPMLTGVADSTLPDRLQVRWRRELPDAVESSAAIVEPSVYVGCDDGVLYVLDLASGAVQWEYRAAGPIKSSPCVYNNTVYFGDDAGTFHAVDLPGRTRKWTFPTEGEIISSANCVDGRVLFGSYDGFLYCLSAGDGGLIWKYETEGRVHGTPGVVGDKVVIAGCDERLRVFRLEDGTSLGAVDMRSFSGASAAISGSRVFVGTFDNTVLGVDYTANRVAWTYQHPERQFPFYASAAVTGDVVVIGGRDKMVHALDAENGKPRWTFPTREEVDSSPVIVGNRVFVGSTDGNLYALELSDGRERWRFDLGAGILASPAVGRGCLVVAAEDGMVYCFADATN